MRRTSEKGTKVNHTKHYKTPAPVPNAHSLCESPSLKLWARLVGLPRVKGSAVSSGRRRRILPAAMAVLVGALALHLSPAFASTSPLFKSELIAEEVFSTRAHIEVEVETGGLKIEWSAKYAPAEAGGAAPPADSPDWVSAGSGTYSGAATRTALGQEGENYDNAVAQYLLPATTYYARFYAENTGGSAEVTEKFTTLSVGKPEVGTTVGSGAGDVTTFEKVGLSPHSASFEAQIQSDGAETEYRFEYTTEPKSLVWKLFSTDGEGTVTVAEDFVYAQAELTGLSPETTYYVRVTASNAKGITEQDTYNGSGPKGNSFVTPTARVVVFPPSVRNVTATSAHIVANPMLHSSETHWRLEYSESMLGPWLPIPGAAGAFSQAQAEAIGERGAVEGVDGTLTKLSPSTTYYVRLFAENAVGEGRYCTGSGGAPGTGCEPLSLATGDIESFHTAGSPAATTFAIHALRGETLRVLGAIDPQSTPTTEEQTVTIEGAPTGGTFTLTFNGQRTGPIAFDAPAEGTDGVREALTALPASPELYVEGPAGGPYTVDFASTTSQSEIEANGSGLTPSGAVAVAVAQKGGESYTVDYHFEYVSQKQFEVGGGQGGFAKAASTPEVDAGSGAGAQDVGMDLPALQPGETYRYRIVATSTSGTPAVDGAEQTLAVPIQAQVGPPEGCPNETLRTGPSAALPDCRAYEQVTPVDKEGSQEIFNYAIVVGDNSAVIGEDGDHLMDDGESVHWGSGPSAGQGPYFFTREATGWKMTSGSPPSEAGVNQYEPQLLSSDLTEFAFESRFAAGGNSESPDIEFKAGPPGGLDTTVATVPKDAAQPGWVAASSDFSKLILSVSDRALLGSGHLTHTKSGNDLYEYSNGELRQMNVTGPAPGTTIGACGATIVHGQELSGQPGSSHALSADGSRVFFEATPGKDCSEAADLYMRVGGLETVDIGEYEFVEANAAGSELLIRHNGLSRYDTETRAVEPVSADESLSPQRYSYSEEPPAELAGFDITNGETANGTGTTYLPGALFGTKGRLADQIIRYDAVEHAIECISCASPFDPEPRLAAHLEDNFYLSGLRRPTVSSANGNFAFFDTPAALVPQDIDGEVEPEYNGSGKAEHESDEDSVSSDVYEWRKDGVNGCAQLQGCLALITDGRGGFLNILLGSADEGRDVFFYSSSQLVGSDDDTAGDIYDARIDGGFPEASRPVECEGDSCSNPSSLPPVQTPATLTSVSSGNVASEATTPVVSKSQSKAKKKGTSKKRGKSKRKGRLKRGRRTRTKHAGRARGNGRAK